MWASNQHGWICRPNILHSGTKHNRSTAPKVATAHVNTKYCECRFIEHGSQADQLEEAGLSAANVIATVRSLVERHECPFQHVIRQRTLSSR